MTVPLAALLATGCSDAGDGSPPTSCSAAPLVTGDSPALEIGVKSAAGESPDVTIRGAGFPAGARVSLAYVGMPSHDPGGPTTDFDFEDAGVVAADGTFAITQRRVGSLESCDASNATTGSIVAGANGMIAGASVPTSFWCTNSTTATWGETCE